ncbi:lysozyme inhibitor LprI family protein [Loktanella sp. R86503]|uniref:lysozyme inhibitor LprI family protein n=1 Tax=Loktanella sp. R86503 TaxID=3093847 RepID=UPI0036DD069E
MKSGIYGLVIAAFCAVPAIGQDLTVDRGDVLACFGNTPIGAIYPDCLGDAANACQDQDGGSTTIGITECIMAETAVWDDMLNEEYTRLQRNFSARGWADGAVTNEELKVALRDAQRAWIAYRDADCGLRFKVWEGGTIRGIVAANCEMTMTASRALDLRDMDRP